ncbi:MAG: hypothetical protein JJU36_08610 [Phycisphaeraceae bacterium]|nr:hypothetical protein [Phycisphaeraceae bacterium]
METPPQANLSIWNLVQIAIAVLLLGGGLLLRWGEAEVDGKVIVGLGGLMLLGMALVLARSVRYESRKESEAGGMGPFAPALLLLLAVLFTISVWYGYILDGELRTWEFRPMIGTLLLTTGVALVAVGAWPGFIDRCVVSLAQWLKRWSGGRLVLAAAMALLVGSTLLAWLVLDAMPHMSDALTYLMQGRVLMAGRLMLEMPTHSELFRHSLFFVEGDAGYYGKYPIGWPTILGAFDALGIAVLAAPLLAGITVWATYSLLLPRCGRGLATLSALLLAATPWLWFNAATMMSHVASLCFLTLFLLGFERARLGQTAWPGLLSGLALGAAIMTRPQDAAFFALPCILLACWLVIRSPRTGLPPMGAVAVGTLPGLAGYFLVNRHLTGEATTTGYENTPVAEIASQSPDSLIQWLAWTQENWAGMSREWFAGTVPAGVAIIVGLVLGWRYARRQPLLLACGLCFLLGYSSFIFVSRPWVGPRWLLPLLPSGSFLIACGLHAAWINIRQPRRSVAFSRAWLRVALTAMLVTWLIVIPVRTAELRFYPPHGVDGRVARAVRDAGLKNAVLALPTEAKQEDANGFAFTYKDPRAGMWLMKAPLERSTVIFVREIEGWQDMARASWPDRKLYILDPEPGTYRILEAEPASNH